MKKVALCLMFIAFVANPVLGQKAYLSHGYTGNSTSLDGLNQIVSNLNEANPWFDQEMGDFGYLDGYRFSFGGYLNAIWADFEMSFRSQKKKAFGTNPLGTLATQQLKLKNNNFAFSFGVGGGSPSAAAAFGVRLDVGQQRLKSRIYGPDSDKGDFELVDDSYLTSRAGPALFFGLQPVGGVLVSLNVYYMFGLPANLTYTDEALNNVEYDDTLDEFDNSNNVFGFTISLGAISSGQ